MAGSRGNGKKYADVAPDRTKDTSASNGSSQVIDLPLEYYPDLPPNFSPSSRGSVMAGRQVKSRQR